MNQRTLELLATLSRNGWNVIVRSSRQSLPDEIRSRYSWLPPDVQEFVEETDVVVSPDEKAWFITTTDLSGQGDAAFSWNQWELDSLEAAGNDSDWQREIRHFWDQNFPVMLSVKSGYAFFAIEKTSLTIVCGEEPEYEEATQIAPSFSEFLTLVGDRSELLARWI